MYVGTKERRPHWAAIGLGASLAFVGCELAYRTLELFVVTPRWTAQWAMALLPARAALAERLALWDELVVGWYVLLLTAHLVGTVGFAVAIGWRRPLIDRALFVTLVASAGLMLVRLAAYLLPALDPIWQSLYVPVNAPGWLALAAALFAWSRSVPIIAGVGR